jgi:hypothetical protein
MRLRFNIRDLLWLTAVVALAIAWWIDHRRLDEQVDYYQRQMFYSGVPVNMTSPR